MVQELLKDKNIPDNFKECIKFHGHMCPGLAYGYIISKKAIELLNLSRSSDEEVVAECENDSCSVDSLQVMLGTTAGKGNLIIKNYGKSIFTIYSRKINKAYRFKRVTGYCYRGQEKEEFLILEKKVSENTANRREQVRQKYLKTLDLIQQPFENIFLAEVTNVPEPPFAELAPSVACASCHEMTMKTKMKKNGKNGLVCIPCQLNPL